MTYHTVAAESHEFTDALIKGKMLAAELNEVLGIDHTNVGPKEQVFAYSVFYVFYEQYGQVCKKNCFKLE